MNQPELSLFLPDYEDVTMALFHAAIDATPAELHGLVTGYILGGERDLKHMADQMLSNKEGPNLEQVVRYFQDILQVSGALLEDENFIYELLLPDEAVELSDRLTALAQWCQGFLSTMRGFKREQESPDVAEAIAAIEQIAAVDPYVEQNDQSEEEYFQLVEFLRMSVILIYEERRFTEGVATKGEASEYLH